MIPSDQAKAVILGLIKTAGGTFEGKTRLFKAFYLAHVYYAQSTGKLLTEWPIVKMPRGPGIDKAPELLSDLIQSQMLSTVPSKTGPFPSTVFHVASDQELTLEPEQLEAIRQSVAYVDGKTAVELSEYSHEYSRSWNCVSDGEMIDVFLDIMDENEFDQLTEDALSIRKITSRVFSDAG